MRGRIIVLEGLDGVGKTTLATALAEKLGVTPLSTPDAALRRERAVFDGLYRGSPDAAHLFYAAAVAHASAVAAREAQAGRDVVIDRYWLSTWAYAVVRSTSLVLAEVEAILCPADVTVLLTVNEAERLERLRARGMTAGDRATFEPGVASRIQERYQLGLGRGIAGHGVELDVTGRNVAECVAAVLSILGPGAERSGGC